jgi:DNA-binding transcriptional regulator YiaG
MAKVEEALRDMVQRHARRAVSSAVSDLPAHLRELRREVREIRKSIDRFSTDLRRLVETGRSAAVSAKAPKEADTARFSPATLKHLRERFDVTQHELARLLEVSPVTVTAWETGKSHPRSANLAQVAALGEKDQAAIDTALGRQRVPDVSAADIKRLRKGLGLTQTVMAKLIGVSAAAVTAWETGKATPSRESRRALGQLAERPRAEVDAQLNRAGLVAPARAALSGEQIRELRAAAGMSQRDLARKLGVSVNSVCNWETGRTKPRRASIKKILELKSA